MSVNNIQDVPRKASAMQKRYGSTTRNWERWLHNIFLPPDLVEEMENEVDV